MFKKFFCLALLGFPLSAIADTATGFCSGVGHGGSSVTPVSVFNVGGGQSVSTPSALPSSPQIGGSVQSEAVTFVPIYASETLLKYQDAFYDPNNSLYQCDVCNAVGVRKIEYVTQEQFDQMVKDGLNPQKATGDKDAETGEVIQEVSVGSKNQKSGSYNLNTALKKVYKGNKEEVQLDAQRLFANFKGISGDKNLEDKVATLILSSIGAKNAGNMSDVKSAFINLVQDAPTSFLSASSNILNIYKNSLI